MPHPKVIQEPFPSIASTRPPPAPPSHACCRTREEGAACSVKGKPHAKARCWVVVWLLTEPLTPVCGWGWRLCKHSSCLPISLEDPHSHPAVRSPAPRFGTGMEVREGHLARALRQHPQASQGCAGVSPFVQRPPRGEKLGAS